MKRDDWIWGVVGVQLPLAIVIVFILKMINIMTVSYLIITFIAYVVFYAQLWLLFNHSRIG